MEPYNTSDLKENPFKPQEKDFCAFVSGKSSPNATKSTILKRKLCILVFIKVIFLFCKDTMEQATAGDGGVTSF